MGPWADDAIYDDDGAFDYSMTIMHRLEGEIAHFLVPEVIASFSKSYSTWLNQILAVIELILLLEQRYSGSAVFMTHYETAVKAVQRWRDIVLNIWDGDWTEPDHHSYDPFAEPQFRQQHRAELVTLFEHLENLSYGWSELDTKPEGLQPMDLPLPYFSSNQFTDPQGRKVFTGGRIIQELLDQLAKDLVVGMVYPWRDNEVSIYTYEDEGVWVAADLLGFLSTVYDRSPGLSAQVVRNWRDKMLEEYKRLYVPDDDPRLDDYHDPIYDNILDSFNRLEAIAQKHPID
jgi:hypothetical protein